MFNHLSAGKKSVLWGLTGSSILIAFYVVVLTLANSPAHVLEQFIPFWPWLSLLIVGFGFQVGLFSFIRYRTQEKKAQAGILAAGGVSAGSMVACCAHHLVDVMAVMGMSAAFVLLAQYQFFFIILGVLGNLVGIIMMLEVIKDHELAEDDSLLSRLVQIELRSWRDRAIAGGLVVLALTFYWVSVGPGSLGSDRSRIAGERTDEGVSTDLGSAENQTLGTLSNSEANVTFEITPVDVSLNKEVRFEVTVTTHQGDLAFDLGQIASLLDDQNNKYQPINWSGGSGGHHLSGELIFPALSQVTQKLTVIIEGAAGVEKRVFEWNTR